MESWKHTLWTAFQADQTQLHSHPNIPPSPPASFSWHKGPLLLILCFFASFYTFCRILIGIDKNIYLYMYICICGVPLL
jgi:hypothetical protein